MLTKLLHLTEKLTGSLLGCLLLGMQVGNTFICVLVVVFGLAATFELQA